MHIGRFVVARLSRCLCVLIAMAGPLAANDAPSFSSDPAVWINSVPLSVQQLRGKAVFLWFYEETCPRCREKWPGLMEKSQKFSDQPIIFIAVNSGNAPSDVRDYADSLRVTWPIIADVDRSFEKACKVGEISLQNITQVRFISSDGALHDGEWDKVDETITEALEGASWKLDPVEVPDALKDTWRALEFGNYKTAGATLKKSVASPKKDIAEGARKLQGVIKKSLTDEVEAAKKESEAGHHWRAFELCQQITDRFGSADLPGELADLKKTLLKEADVKTGAASRKAVEMALKGLSAGRPLAKKAKAQLEKIVADYPDSDLSRDAQRALDHVIDSQQ